MVSYTLSSLHPWWRESQLTKIGWPLNIRIKTHSISLTRNMTGRTCLLARLMRLYDLQLVLNGEISSPAEVWHFCIRGLVSKLALAVMTPFEQRYDILSRSENKWRGWCLVPMTNAKMFRDLDGSDATSFVYFGHIHRDVEQSEYITASSTSFICFWPYITNMFF